MSKTSSSGKHHCHINVETLPLFLILKQTDVRDRLCFEIQVQAVNRLPLPRLTYRQACWLFILVAGSLLLS